MVRRGRRRWSSDSASRVAARRSAPRPPERGCWCWSAPPPRAGPSAMAGGHFYLGGGTAVQEATGHDDTAEEMYKYLVAVSAEPDLEKIRAYCDGSVEHFNWLEALGFQFERSYWKGKIVVPPGTEGLSYTGNEKVWPFCEQAKPAPRGHSVPVPGELGGAAMVIDLLVKRADELGVEIRYETGVTNLVVERRRGGRGDVEAFHRNRRDQGQIRHHRRGWVRDESRHGRRAHPRTGPGAQDQAPRHGRALHPGQSPRRRAGHPDGRLGGRRGQEPGRTVHHRRRLPAGDPADGRHRQQRRPAVRRRGLLPLAHLGLRSRAARPDRRI